MIDDAVAATTPARGGKHRASVILPPLYLNRHRLDVGGDSKPLTLWPG
jgi:hypothetical protein